MVILIIIVFALIAAFQAPRLIKAKQYKELVVFSIFLLIGFALNLMLALGVPIPNPTEGVKAVLNAIGLHF